MSDFNPSAARSSNLVCLKLAASLPLFRMLSMLVRRDKSRKETSTLQLSKTSPVLNEEKNSFNLWLNNLNRVAGK